MPVDARLHPILDAANAQPAPAGDLSVEAQRDHAHEVMAQSFLFLQEEGPEVASIVERTVRVDNEHTQAAGVEPADITVRIYTPQGVGPFPAHLYLHGGGFWIGRPRALRRGLRGRPRRARVASSCPSTTASRRSPSSRPRPRTATPRRCGSSTTQPSSASTPTASLSAGGAPVATSLWSWRSWRGPGRSVAGVPGARDPGHGPDHEPAVGRGERGGLLADQEVDGAVRRLLPRRPGRRDQPVRVAAARPTCRACRRRS